MARVVAGILKLVRTVLDVMNPVVLAYQQRLLNPAQNTKTTPSGEWVFVVDPVGFEHIITTQRDDPERTRRTEFATLGEVGIDASSNASA